MHHPINEEDRIIGEVNLAKVFGLLVILASAGIVCYIWKLVLFT